MTDARGKSALFEIGYQPALDGLRGLSILAVMAFNAHISFVRGGFIGVDLFFVLSGFLITSLLVEEHQRTSTIRLRKFFFRRALRLLPALFVLMIFCAAYALLLQPRAKAVVTFEGILYTLFYVANWAQVGSVTATIGALSHAWSLSVEEQFYIIWPLLLIALLKLRNRVWIAGILIVLAAGSLAWSSWLWHAQPNYLRMYFGSDTRAYELLIGCVAALLVNWRSIPQTRLVKFLFHTVSLISFAAILYSCWAVRVYSGFGYNGGFALISLGVAIVIIDMVLFPSTLSRFLEFSPLVWVGRISYGLYLWHFPIFETYRQLLAQRVSTVVYVALCFVTVLLAATASYFIVEKPFLNLRRRYPSRSADSAATMFGSPHGSAVNPAF
jgi:peptidoglycan/LPS O-acetylase OafA/YrhL